MDKVVREGWVAVLYSSWHGSGWSTWNPDYAEQLMFDPGAVDLVLNLKWDELESYLTLKYPKVYPGDVRSLKVRWVPEGAKFRIDEYDGNETVILREEDKWFIA